MTTKFVCAVAIALASGAYAIPHSDPSVSTMVSLEQDAKLQDLELRIQALSAENDAEKNDDDDMEKMVAEAEKNDDDAVVAVAEKNDDDAVVAPTEVREESSGCASWCYSKQYDQPCPRGKDCSHYNQPWGSR